MRVTALAFLFAPLSVVLAIDEPASTVPETVVVPSGKLELKAFLWKPNGLDDGHNFLYLGIPQWEHDVFGFLDEYLKH